MAALHFAKDLLPVTPRHTHTHPPPHPLLTPSTKDLHISQLQIGLFQEKTKTKTFAIFLYLELPVIQLRQSVFVGYRMGILAVGLLVNSGEDGLDEDMT